jgi:hypothetical protein
LEAEGITPRATSAQPTMNRLPQTASASSRAQLRQHVSYCEIDEVFPLPITAVLLPDKTPMFKTLTCAAVTGATLICVTRARLNEKRVPAVTLSI